MYDLQDYRWIKNKNQIIPTQKKVVLTFDDGPSRQLENILDILKEKDVQAAFFWQSRLLHGQRPWKRVIDEGHQIGAHSNRHKNLVHLTREQQLYEIKKSVHKIEKVTNQQVRAFRPPFGQYNEDTISILEQLDLLPVMWEISSYDWENRQTPNKISCNITEHMMDGSIILLHELVQTVSILPQLIDKIREMGYNFTSLD